MGRGWIVGGLALTGGSLAAWVVAASPPTRQAGPAAEAPVVAALRGGPGVEASDAAGEDPAEAAATVDAPQPAAPARAVSQLELPPHDPGELPRWIVHRPVPTETIEQLALRYDSTAASIRRANGLDDDEQPRRRRPRALKIYAKRYPPPRVPHSHLVLEGEGWGSVSRHYGVDSMELRKQTWGSTGASLEAGERMNFWIDPTVVRSIREDAPTSDRMAQIDPGAHGRGTPQDGILIAGVQIPEGAGYELRYPNSAWGTTYAVRNTVRALDAYASRSDHPHPIRVGTMSRQRGREVGGHNSHQTGRDLDIRLPLRAEVPQALPVLLRRVDWDALWLLVRAFEATGAVQVIFLDYKAQRRLHEAGLRHGATEEELARLMQWPRGWAASSGLIRHESGHADHIHVRFHCGPAEPECAD